MKKAIQLMSIVVFGSLIASCGNKSDQADAGAAQVKEYKVLELQPRSATLYTDYPASIQGQQNIEIRPRVDGYVEKIYVDEGAVVKKGQPLFKINAPQYEQEVRTATASIKSAESNVSAAKLAVNKVKPLVEKDIVSKYELESAQYAYESALAALAQARAALVNARTNQGYTLVSSPVNGVVGSIPFRLGSLVSGNNAEPLTTVSSIGNVYAYFALNEKQLLDFIKDSSNVSFQKKITQMPEVSLVLSDGTLYNKKGRIETINGLINTSTGSANIRAAFPNTDGLIRSGSSATVRIPKHIKNALLVPQSATFELQDKRLVIVLGADSTVKTAAVKVMQSTAGQYFVVTEGLKTGDIVVLEGVNTLKEGTKIKAAPVDAESVYGDLK